MGIVCKKHDFVGKRGTQFGEQNLLYILQKQTIFLNQKAGADDFTVFFGCCSADDSTRNSGSDGLT